MEANGTGNILPCDASQDLELLQSELLVLHVSPGSVLVLLQPALLLTEGKRGRVGEDLQRKRVNEDV